MSEFLKSITFPSGQTLEIRQGDITLEEADGIVNAANDLLQHGGGVAGAIVRRGGWSIQEESTRWVKEHGAVTHEAPAYTGGRTLPCRYVIHAVGPVWGDGDEDVKLAAAVRGSLKVADELKLTSLAMPAISTGIFGFPIARAARIILNAIREYYARYPNSGLKLVRLILYGENNTRVFVDGLDNISNEGTDN